VVVAAIVAVATAADADCAIVFHKHAVDGTYHPYVPSLHFMRKKPMSKLEVIVGVIGKPSGLQGAVSLTPRTDDPFLRFRQGNRLRVEQNGRILTVKSVSRSSNERGARYHASFHEITDRNQAEEARGWVLLATVDSNDRPEDPEEFYDWQLIGLEARDAADQRLGEVVQVVHNPENDLLAIKLDDYPDNEPWLLPFFAVLVPIVALDDGYLRLADIPTRLPGHPAALGQSEEAN
jgi:16S rRNA processing protein RimM